jgi:hypothetical protein
VTPIAARERTLVYTAPDGLTYEHARIRTSESGAAADGAIVGLREGQPIRLRYEVTCDSRWHVRSASVEAMELGRTLLALAADEDGTWQRVDGGVLDEPLYRAYDVSLPLTPVTTALTIRRLALEPGQSQTARVCEIDVPTLRVRLVEHRYTCLALEADESRYRFESLAGGQRATIIIDSDGVVREYEGGFRRIWPMT